MICNKIKVNKLSLRITLLLIMLMNTQLLFSKNAISENNTSPPVLYIVSMMHAEDNVSFHTDEVVFNNVVQGLTSLRSVFDSHGAKMDIGPDWTFVQGVINWNSTFLTDHIAAGHGIHTHAHETTPGFELEGLNDLLLTAGLSYNIIANGGFNQTYPPNQNWVGYIASILDINYDQRFSTIIGYKNAATQISDGTGYIFRPSIVGNWKVHDPNSPLIYIGSNSDEVDHGVVLDFDTLRPWITDRLANLSPNKINTLYWHDSMHNYINPAVGNPRIIRWNQELTEFFDPLVAQGLVEWKTFEEMTYIFLDDEELIFISGFEG